MTTIPPEVGTKARSMTSTTTATTSSSSLSSSSMMMMIPLNVNDYQRLARTKLPPAVYEYLASGSDDEHTLQENQAAFARWYLRPRVLLRPLGTVSTRTILFGRDVAMPVFCSPAGVQALCDPAHGECATARAAGRANILFGLSQHATRSIEQVAAAAPDTFKFYQLYILKDRTLTLQLLQRALDAGYEGACVCVFV